MMGVRCCGFGDLTSLDILKLSLPVLWVLLGVSMFCYHLVNPMITNRFPSTLPLFWSLISTFPAFMTALNIYVYHVSQVKENGMSLMTMVELSRGVRTISIIGIIVYIILAVSSVVQLTLCYRCGSTEHAEGAFWFLSTLLFMLTMGCTAPRSGELNDLAQAYERKSPPRHQESGFLGRIDSQTALTTAGSRLYAQGFAEIAGTSGPTIATGKVTTGGELPSQSNAIAGSIGHHNGEVVLGKPSGQQ